MNNNENKIIHGDCQEIMKDFDDNSIDLICSDIPYGLTNLDPLKLIEDEEIKSKGFMGKDWDNIPSTAIFKECHRVLKDGAFMFLQFTTRQDAVTVLNYRLLQAGFNINFTSMFWVYGTGFPKAINISKAIDKKFGAEREVVGKYQRPDGTDRDYINWNRTKGITDFNSDKYNEQNRPLSLPSTPEAKQFDGSYGGFQPKPAVELIVVAMKPLSEKTFTEQCLKNGKGITWLDDCRIPSNKNDPNKRENSSRSPNYIKGNTFSSYKSSISKEKGKGSEFISQGRFPANILVQDDILNDGVNYESGWNENDLRNGQSIFNTTDGKGGSHYNDRGSFSRYFDLDAWFSKKLSELPERVQKTFPFFIVAKPSKSEKNRGCEYIEKKQTNDGRDKLPDNAFQRGQTFRTNFHPTCKPLKLYTYLITMGSRENDVVLDPFAGSGTTCIASAMLKRNYIGIDSEEEYCKIAEARLNSIENTFFDN
jgi:site-specific DNA-methyltransferase (adenine-specific)